MNRSGGERPRGFQRYCFLSPGYDQSPVESDPACERGSESARVATVPRARESPRRRSSRRRVIAGVARRFCRSVEPRRRLRQGSSIRRRPHRSRGQRRRPAPAHSMLVSPRSHWIRSRRIWGGSPCRRVHRRVAHPAIRCHPKRHGHSRGCDSGRLRAVLGASHALASAICLLRSTLPEPRRKACRARSRSPARPRPKSSAFRDSGGRHHGPSHDPDGFRHAVLRRCAAGILRCHLAGVRSHHGGCHAGRAVMWFATGKGEPPVLDVRRATTSGAWRTARPSSMSRQVLPTGSEEGRAEGRS